MSRRNRIGKELARERAALVQAEAEYRAKRNRRLAIYGPILGVVLVGAVLTLVLSTHAFSSSSTPTANASSVKATSSASASASSTASPSASAKASASASATSSPSASKS
jgi:hypothetical protein